MIVPRPGVASALLALLLPNIVAAQSVFTWTTVTPPSSPPARSAHAMAFDSARGRTVLFGGNNASGAPLADTWEWDGTTWLAAFSASFPSARAGHAMAYDSARGKTVLFGGSSTTETWEWNGVNWSLVATTGPSARSYCAMAYDSARQRTVLFGGIAGTTLLGDTWEWDGSSWTQVASIGPSARQRTALTFDSLRNRTILFGGDAGSLNSDTWEWNGSTWVQIGASGPSGRAGHCLSFDSSRGKVVLAGGFVFWDSWDYDGTAWVSRIGFAFGGVIDAASVHDRSSLRVVMFGGTVGTSPSNATRLLDAHDTATSVPFGAACGVPPLTLQPDAAHPPITNTIAIATVTNAPTPFGAAMIGLSKTQYGPFPLPVTLGFLGMPGCDLLQSGDIQGWPLTPTSPTTLTFSAFLAPTPTLVGMHLYLQAYVYAPGVNAAELVTSNGIDWYVGNV